MEDKENRFYGFTNKFLKIVGMLARRFCGGLINSYKAKRKLYVIKIFIISHEN
jgi:hypothetical protein